MISTKYTTDDRLITPRPNGSNCEAMLQSDTRRDTFTLERNGQLTLLGSTSAIFMKTSGMLKISPRMKPIVRFLVRKDAIMPIEIMARPVNQ